MAEMKVYDTVFPFACDNPGCGKEYDLEGFRDVAQLWGFIYLRSGIHDIIGITCPDCIKTSIKKFPSDTETADLVLNTNFVRFVPFSPKILADVSKIKLPELTTKSSDISYMIPQRVISVFPYPSPIKDKFIHLMNEKDLLELLIIENKDGY